MLAALGVLVVVSCAAVGAKIAGSVDHRAGYLAVATYLPQGSVIAASDLSVVDAGLSGGVQAIPQDDERLVVGQRASEPLEPGSLLVPRELTASVPLPTSEALVGASLASDQAPTGLDPGDVVLVVLSGSGADVPSGAAASRVLALGNVYAIALPSASSPAGSSDDETVTLEVPATDAAAVTAASAAGDVSLAEVSAKEGA